MGNTKQSLPKLQKFDVEILLDKIYQHMLIQRDRKINELAQKEIKQREQMRDKKCRYEDVSFEFISIVSIFNYIQAVKIIMRYCKSLKDYSIRICTAQHKRDFDEIEDLQPYIEGIIWSAEKLNLSYIKEFNNLIYKYFGSQVYQKLRQYNQLDSQLKSLFTNIEPSTREIQDYLTKFLIRYKLQMADFPEGNNGFGDDNNGGKKEDFMDKINGLKFENDDSSKNPNLDPPQQNYQDIPLDNNFNNQLPNNQQFQNQQNYQPQNNNDQNNYTYPQNVDYPAYDNQQSQNNFQNYQNPQNTLQDNQKQNNDNFDDLINQLDEDNGISGLKDNTKKKNSAMDMQSDFVTKKILPTDEQPKNQQDIQIGQKIDQKALDYEATKYYVNSLIGKDNDYKIDIGDSMKPDEKN